MDEDNYRGYDEYLSKKFNMTIKEMYGQSIYKDRNMGLVKFVLKDKPKAIFEFACTYNFLAIDIIKELPDVKYICTNFLPEVVEYIQNNGGVRSFVFDANNIPITDLTEFDAFVCTSLEHLENDITIIDSLPKPSIIYFCVTNMPDKTHVWSFDDEWDIYDRYKDVMRIVDHRIFNSNNRIKMIGKGIHD